MFQSVNLKIQSAGARHDVAFACQCERLKLAFQECREMEGTLNQRLDAYAAAGRQIFPAYGEAVDRLVARIHENGGGENAPRPGDVMPPFILPDVTGRLIDLKSLLENGPVAVMFYRGHWCPYCRLNVGAVVQAWTGSRRWAVRLSRSCQRCSNSQRVQIRFRRAIPGSDRSRQWLCTFVESRHLARNRDTAASVVSGHENFHGNDGWMLPIPRPSWSPRRLVKARFVDPDFRKRMEIDDLIAAFRAAN